MPEMPEELLTELVTHLLYDGSRDGIILADKVNRIYGASAKRRREREAEGG